MLFGRMTLCTQCHDRIHDIVIVLLERLDGLLARHAGLRHDQIDILGFQTRLVHLFTIILVFVRVLAAPFERLAGPAHFRAMIVTGVSVAVAGRARLGRRKLLSSRGLRGGVEVFDLGFSKDAR